MAFDLPQEGTRRLRLCTMVGATAGVASALALVLILYGPPFWPGWWFVMAGILVASLPASFVAASAIEWVIAGYRVK